MKKTTFEITKMDCPSEENLIRMKLDEISSIANLEFDIPNRKLIVFHSGEIEQIEKYIIELNLGGKKILTDTLVCPRNQLCFFHYRNNNRVNLKINGAYCR